MKSYDRTKFLPPRSGIQGITQKYLGFIASWERIGRYKDKNDQKIDILIIKLKKGASLYYARSSQRNFVADYLQGKIGTTTEKDAALCAFVSPDEEDWRFSLVKIDYKIEETPTGKIKVKEEFTPAKRWSFLVGRNEKSHTAQSKFVPLLEGDCHWSFRIPQVMDTRIPHPQGYLICVLESIGMGIAPMPLPPIFLAISFPHLLFPSFPSSDSSPLAIKISLNGAIACLK